MAFNGQILKDNNGNDIGIFLTMADYEKLLRQVEELEDIKAYDKAKSENEEVISLREAIKLRRSKNG